MEPASRLFFSGQRLCALGLLVVLSLFPSCGKGPSIAPPEKPAPAVELIPNRPHPRVLGSAPAFVLTDQESGPFSSSQLAGAPWVANFMFTRCPTICPRQTAVLKTIQDSLTADTGRQDVRLVSFRADHPGFAGIAQRWAARAG